MGTGRWTQLGIGALAALVLAVTVGTAAVSMANDDNKQGTGVSRDLGQDDSDGGAFAMCIEGTVDCQDTVLNPENVVDCGDDGCDVTDEFPAPCPADTACIEPWLMDPPTCEPGLTIEECFPDGVPAGVSCVTLESFPVQVRCTNDYASACIETLPAPVDEDDQKRAEEERARAAEQGIAVGEPAPDSGETMVAPDCSPVVDPCNPPQPNVRCMDPDCSVSSDGSIACPGGFPDCDVATDADAGTAPELDETVRILPCTLPEDCGDDPDSLARCAPACEPGPAVDCGPVDLPLEECIPGPAVDCGVIDVPSGAGSSGSAGSGSDPLVDPAAAQ